MRHHTSPWMTVDIVAAADGSRRAEVVISGWIGPDWRKEDKGERQNTAEGLRAELKALADAKVAAFDVRINSPGGSIAHGLAIHDLLAASGVDVTTYVEGMTASIATVIAQAGRTRKMSANGLFLIHRGISGGYGNLYDLAAVVGDLQAVDDRMADIYAKRSGKSRDSVLNQMDANKGRGEWISAERAKQLGLIDEVVEPTKAVAAVDDAALTAFGLPPVPGELAAAVAEQNRQTVTGSDTEPPQPPSQKDSTTMKLTPEQVKTLGAKFGADVALAAVADDLDFAAAMERGADALAAVIANRDAAIAGLKTERDALTAKVAELTAKLADPLKPSEPPAAPPAAAGAKVLPIPEAHAELVKAGKTPADAWAQLRAERPDEYAEHFGMAGK